MTTDLSLSDGQIASLHRSPDAVRMNANGFDLRNIAAGLVTTTRDSRYSCYGSQRVHFALTEKGERVKSATTDRYAAILAERAARY